MPDQRPAPRTGAAFVHVDHRNGDRRTPYDADANRLIEDAIAAGLTSVRCALVHAALRQTL